jgi:hypothetical protein
MMEKLEARCLFSTVTDTSVTLNGSILCISGSDFADAIFVTQEGPDFNISLQSGTDLLSLASIPQSLVSRITLYGNKGDDFLVLQTLDTVGGDVFGGDGNDEIHLEDLGSGASTAHGDCDNDLIVVFHGSGTQAFGDNGKDTLMSLEMLNTTYLFGGNGDDILMGSLATLMDGGSSQNLVQRL